MKKTTTLILMIVILTACFCMMACTCTPPFGKFGMIREEISSIELIRYDAPEQKHFPNLIICYFLYKDLPFDNDRCTVLETLPKDKEHEFIEGLQDAEKLSRNTTNTPNGYCLKITYTNTNFLIICLDNENDGFIGEYASDGTVVNHRCENPSHRNDFAVLANKYFTYQVPAPNE